MALQDSAAAEAHGCEHLLARMADGVAEHDVPPEAVPDLRQVCAQAFVEAKRHVERFELAPERLVVRIVPVAAIDRIGTKKDAFEAELLHCALRFGDRIVDLERRDHAGTDQALRVHGAEVVEPIVVGSGDRGRQLRLHPVDPLSEEPPCWIDDRNVDALLVHGLELRFGAPAALLERAEPLTVALRRSSARLRRVGDVGRHELAVDLDTEIEHPVGKPARRLVLEGRVDVARPEIGRLDDVDVAIEHAEAIFRHRRTSPSSASEFTTSCRVPLAEPLDADALSADSRAHRATRGASDVSSRLLKAESGFDGRRRECPRGG